MFFKYLKVLYFSFPVFACFFFSCTGRYPNDKPVYARMDSLIADNEQLNFFINTLSESMDSIIIQEGNILEMAGSDGIRKTTRVQAMEKLAIFKAMLDRQHKSILILQDSLNNMSSSSSAKIRNIISFYKKELDEKDRLITQLRSELSDKDTDISKFAQRVSSLNSDLASLSSKNKEQKETLKAQDNIINECYVMIGTKKDLQKAGVLSSSGIFRKKALNVSNLTPDSFDKVDIRYFTEVTINGKNPVILSQMPSDSYTFDKLGKNSYVLRVIDTASFWSISNYLVIQYN